MSVLLGITVVVRGEDGFHWVDAAAGAAAALGLAALVCGLVLLGLRSRRSAAQGSFGRAREG